MLRFNWLYSLIPPGHNPLPFIHSSTLPIFVTTIVTVCELLRRTMWGFFRLENEQINNTEVGFISRVYSLAAESWHPGVKSPHKVVPWGGQWA